MTLDLFKELAAWAAFGAWFSFVATYSALAKWWRSPEGRNVWLVGLALTVAFGIIVAAYTWPDYAMRPYIVPILYVALAALGFQRLVQMIRRQRQRRRNSH